MVPGVPFLYGAFQEADLKELVPLVALVAQMWMRAHPGFLSPCSSSAVSSGGGPCHGCSVLYHTSHGAARRSLAFLEPPRSSSNSRP